MSKLRKYSTHNISNNNILSTEPKDGNNNNININQRKRQTINNITKKEEQKIKTPKEILSLLLKNTLGRSIFKLEKSTKEQSSTLKEIGKYFIFFEKKILSMKNGVEKKRKEEEKKQQMARKLRMTSNPNHTRSRTVQTLRKNNRKESNANNISNIKNNMKIKMKRRATGLLNLVETPKRSKTVKPLRYNTTSNLSRIKNSKDMINTPKRIKNEDKEKLSRTLQRKDSIKLSKIRKNSIYKKREEDKTDERIRRKSMHKMIKKNSSKKNIKLKEEKNKNNINIATNINTIKNSDIKNSDISHSNEVDFSQDKEKDKISNQFDINLDDSLKNININEILKDKNKEEERNKIKMRKSRLLKELEEYNEKKPKMEESKNNNIDLKRNRSRSKNKEDEINEYKEMEGSLNDMHITLEGLNILKRQDKKIRFEKKKKNEKEIKREEIINKEIKDLLESDNEMKEQNKKENNNKKEDIKSLIINVENNNNDKINKNISVGKECQIINEEIINTIENDKNILNNSILENNINILNKDIEKNEFMDNISNKNENENLIKSINHEKIICEDNDINDNNKDNKPDEKVIVEDNDINNNNNKDNKLDEKENKLDEKENKKDENNNNINNNDKENINNNVIENNLDEKTKVINEDKKEIIQSEAGINNDEQLVDPNKSLLNQSSILNQTAILSEQYVLISKDEDSPFSIENVLKFEKSQILGVLDFLNFQEKIQFTGINRGFNIERIYILNDKREELIKGLDLNSDETIDDLIMKIKLKYSNEELNKEFTPFQVSRGAAKAVELLNNPLYSKLFKKSTIEKNADEICKVYRTLFTLLGEYHIANIPEDEYFWIKCTEYLNNKSEGKIGSFILNQFKNINFDKRKIVLINKFMIGMKKKINPNYFPKICGTTGLLIFLIKDALEYCGVIINDKKTQPARILDNLMYYKKCIETLAQIIENLSGLKTYKKKEKKEK